MTFLIIMMSSMSLLLAMSDFIINANDIYYLLKNDIDNFSKEAKVIDEAKCYLINYKNLDDFDYDGAYGYETGDGYKLIYDDLIINLVVEDGIITDYYFN